MGITEDLMTKIAADVTATMHRTLAIAPEQLPVAVSGGAAAIGTIAAILAQMSGSYKSEDTPDDDNVLLAALLCARLGSDPKDGIGRAYKDLERLKTAAV